MSSFRKRDQDGPAPPNQDQEGLVTVEYDQMPVSDEVSTFTTSGAPDVLQKRIVRIYQPSKSTTQSGKHENLAWRMDWDIVPEAHGWEHPLMGW